LGDDVIHLVLEKALEKHTEAEKYRKLPTEYYSDDDGDENI
jgi:hypothetical protein